ncbi:MAG: hypothetical protein KDD35_13010, partial [Bdellovibrionales bacterium]|nr:hypothetical protein [Bdellovibrionales bacterium]
MNIVGSPISKQVVSCLVFLSFSFLSSVSRANSEGLNNDSGSSKSVPMSPGAIYARCFAVFTGTAVNPKDLTHAEVLSQLEKGDKSYVDACMNVLSRANLDSTTQRISSDSDAIAVNVLKTFQDFNASIFTFRRNSEFQCQNSFNNDLIHAYEPSFH